MMNDHINECVLECICVCVRLEYCLCLGKNSNESLLHQSITDAPMVSLIMANFNQTEQLKERVPMIYETTTKK